MEIVISSVAVIVLLLSCLGSGVMVLRAIGFQYDLDALETASLAFAVGFGIVGWTFFWLGVSGLFSAEAALITCGLLSFGAVRYFSLPYRQHNKIHIGRWDTLLLLLVAIAVCFDGFEALAPPVEADSLAYHFDLARRFSEAGSIYFIPRALDGAVPLLVHMTYVAAYSMGGELALTLWTFVSGWGASVLLFALSRRWLGLTWSLAIAILFQTLPAMIYGAGSGQVEARLALFVLIAVFGLLHARGRENLPAIILIGLGAGFYAGSKYTGLLFMAAVGITLLFLGSGWLRRCVVFSVVAMIVAGQWYGWNFLHTGDPIFPALFNLLGLPDGPIWDTGYAADFSTMMAARAAALEWWERWLAFPVIATLFPSFAIEAGRVGLGPFFLMIAPISLYGFWRYRHRVRTSALGPVALAVAAFYLLWLQFGGIPKVRHLIPVIPPLVLCLSVVAKRVGGTSAARPLALAFIVALSVNFAAAGFFVRPFIEFAASGGDRQKFLRKNVNDYDAVAWLNTNETPRRVMALQRQFIYYSQAPTFFVFPYFQKTIEARPGKVGPGQLFDQLVDGGFTHVISHRMLDDHVPTDSIYWAILELEKRSCLTIAKKFKTTWHTSRTLPNYRTGPRETAIWRVSNWECQPEPLK